MKHISLIVFGAGMLCGAMFAQAPRTPEHLSAWPYYKEIQLPAGSGPLADVVLDRETLDKARVDQADLRLYDGTDREVPYVLYIRREVDVQDAFTAREFDRAVEGASARLSCDLGEGRAEHNEVAIETTGNNFRRLAEVQGSPDGVQWLTLASEAILFRFSARGRTVEQPAVAYPPSRYRYLRVRVRSDPQVDRAAPEITSLRVRRSIHMNGEMVPWPAGVEGREADRVDARPASIWRMDLDGRVPLERLVVSAGDAAFSRPFTLEIADDPAASAVIASGDLTRREEAPAVQPTIDFGERYARRLKLTVIDDRNAPLNLTAVTAFGPARQLVFETASVTAAPVRLYYGNARALAPHYDLAARLSAMPKLHAARLRAGSQQSNPSYRPEPKPLSERSPWLVYLVLCAASAMLAAILTNVVRTSQRRTATV